MLEILQEGLVVDACGGSRTRARPLTKWSNADSRVLSNHLRQYVDDWFRYCLVVNGDEVFRLGIHFQRFVKAKGGFHLFRTYSF